MAKGKKGKKSKKSEDKAKKGGKGKKGKKGDGKKGKKVAEPKMDVAQAMAQGPCEPLVKKFDPCRYSPESCAEALGCRPNAYPGLLERPEPMAVVGSESGTYESLCKLLQTGFRCTNRILLITPWGNYVVFRVKSGERTVFFVFDGCTCNVNRFRYYDLNVGTAGLLFFKTTHEVLLYIKDSRHKREHFNRMRKSVVDEICREYGEEIGDMNNRKQCPSYKVN